MPRIFEPEGLPRPLNTQSIVQRSVGTSLREIQDSGMYGRAKGISGVTGLATGSSVQALKSSGGTFSIDVPNELMLVGSATAPLTGIGIFLGLDDPDYEFRVGDPSGNYLHWNGSSLTVVGTITASSGTIGGWTIGANSLQADSLTLVGGSAPRITMGGATGFTAGDGIYIGEDISDGLYKFRVGAATSSPYVRWNGSSLQITGASISGLSAGSSPALLGWTHNLVFSATDSDTVAWTSGTITFQDGSTRAINAGNTGNMTAATYIYLDDDVSSTALQTSTTASNSVGNNRVLVAVAEDVASPKDAEFIVFGGSGAVGISKLIVADNIAANTISGNEIAANTITGGNISSMDIQTKTLVADTGSVGGWDLAAGSLSSGDVIISSSLEQILLGDATAPNTGVGIFLGLDGSDYEFRAGDPAGDYMHWDGSNLAIVGEITATSGSIAGWTISSTELSSGNLKIQSTAERLLFGAATAPLTGTGIFLGLDGSVYEFRAGTTSVYMHWDGTTLNVTADSTFGGVDVGGQLSLNDFLNLAAATGGITASTTQTQGQQTLLQTVNIVTVVANANDVVTLPASERGRIIYIRNEGANTLQIFPDSGGNIDGTGVDASITLAANTPITLICQDASTKFWWSF